MGDLRIPLSESEINSIKQNMSKSIIFRWLGDATMAEYILGQKFNVDFWKKWGMLNTGRMHWDWYNEIVQIEKDAIRLKKPLRLEWRPSWTLRIIPAVQYITGVGIEHIGIRMPVHDRPGHLMDPGFNAIYMFRALHGWIRDVIIENADNGLILEQSSQITITGLKVAGEPCHHATTYRFSSNDNLMTDFRVSAKPHHGISCQDLASGNVWSNGVLEHGTLDSHCGMPFDSIRTNITIVNCDGVGGGAESAGPFAGRRVVHWNIRVEGVSRRKGLKAFARPDQYSWGAIVGLQGVEIQEDRDPPWHMPPGIKGTIVADPGIVPNPPDLYRAQLELRLKSK
jgi:hypothetical protein